VDLIALAVAAGLLVLVVVVEIAASA